MKSAIVRAGVSLLVSMALCCTAHATTISMHFDGVGLGQGITAHAYPGPDSGNPGTRKDVGTTGGFYDWTKIAGDYDEIADGQMFSTMCIDVAQTISVGGTYTFTVVDLTAAPDPTTYAGGSTISAAQKGALQKLYARNLGLIGVNAQLACAFQIAVWEIVFEHWTDPAYDPLAGSFYVSGNTGAANAAITMLGTINSPWQNGEIIPNLVAFISSVNQDQMWLVPGGGAPVVPEPVTMLGLVLGLGGLGGYIRKRRML